MIIGICSQLGFANDLTLACNCYIGLHMLGSLLSLNSTLRLGQLERCTCGINEGVHGHFDDKLRGKNGRNCARTPILLSLEQLIGYGPRKLTD